MSLINFDSPMRNAAGPIVPVSAQRTFESSSLPDDLDYSTTSDGHLPVELHYTILEFYLGDYLGDNVPPRHLALVCKKWRAWLRGTPTFWRNLQAIPVEPDNVGSQSNILMDRVVLSGSTKLNITLDLNLYNPVHRYRLDLFSILARTGLDRWQTLRLITGRNEFGSIIALERTFTGKLTSLESFTRSVSGKCNPFEPLEELLVQSNPPIQVAIFGPTDPPSTIYGTSVLRQVTDLHADSQAIQKSGPYPNLKKLYAYVGEEGIDPALFPPLPPDMTFSSKLRRSQFAALQLKKVENLVIGTLLIQKDEQVIELPNLVSLVIETGIMSSARHISAPKLMFLGLGRDVTGYCPPRETFERDVLVPSDPGERLLVTPVTIILYVTVPVIASLLDWPQLEHLGMRLNESSWEIFMDYFAKEVCPNLKTLTLFLLSSDTTKDGTAISCEEFVERVWEVREGSPLQSITWTAFFNDGLYWNKRNTVVYPEVGTE